jgi:hypothetical protein
MPRSRLLFLCGLVWTGSVLLLTSCASSGPSKEAAAAAPSGSTLWAQNCLRCHNAPTPTRYSQTQWDVVMLHMRIRAGLTAQDSRAILDFLKSAD